MIRHLIKAICASHKPKGVKLTFDLSKPLEQQMQEMADSVTAQVENNYTEQLSKFLAVSVLGHAGKIASFFLGGMLVTIGVAGMYEISHESTAVAALCVGFLFSLMYSVGIYAGSRVTSDWYARGPVMFLSIDAATDKVVIANLESWLADARSECEVYKQKAEGIMEISERNCSEGDSPGAAG